MCRTMTTKSADIRPPLCLGLVASPSLRSGPQSPMIRFLREFQPYLRDVVGAKLFAMEGTYRSILRNGLFYDYGDLEMLPPGYQGGMVTLTAMVVRNPERAREEHLPTLDAVIYLIDPRDANSLYPESIALKRECVVDDEESPSRTFIPTYDGAREWAMVGWYLNDHDSVGRHYLTKEPAEAILGLATRGVDKPIREQTIALISHDAKKEEMLKFAREQVGLLRQFKRRHATGTTGKLLNGTRPGKMRAGWNDDEQLADMVTQWDLLRKTLDEELAESHKVAVDDPDFPAGFDWVTPEPSGPRGGDVQIAERVLTGECHKVIFFEDPHVSREHEADIQLLERTSRVPGQDVMCLHDYNSATEWARNRKACYKKDERFEPLTLVRAFQIAFGVELVLCEDLPEEGQLWGDILDKAAWYLVNLVADFAGERPSAGRGPCIAMTWGYSMKELMDQLREVKKALDKRDEKHPQLDLSPRLADREFLRPEFIRVLPMVGIMGSRHPEVEANANVARLGEFYEVADPEFLPHSAFVERGTVEEGAKGFTLPWGEVDIAVFTCGPLQDHFGTEVKAPVPGRLFEQMKQARAVGEISGLYLDADGEWIEPREFLRLGMGHQQLRQVAKNHGALLVAGVQKDERAEVVLAALRGGFASTIVSDIEFAKRVLELHLEDVQQSP